MRGLKFPGILFFCVLAFHVWAVRVGWDNGNLPGNEFRQTQTALTALFVQRENNFSLAYPTPVLGKPWTVPFEFPLYQWTVVVVSNATGISLVSAARGVSAVCFYLTLPALWLLLGRLAVPRPLRWIVLTMVVVCPLHIFYARAFLIEMMALMFGVWFLQAYVTAVERRSVGWLLAANVAGMGVGLVKVTTFIVYLIPALIWTLWWFTRDWKEGGGVVRWVALRQRIMWAALAVAAPFAATVAWIHFTDAVKAATPVTDIMVSANLRSHNFGTWALRMDPKTWSDMWTIQTTNIAGLAVLLIVLMIGLLRTGRWWRWAVGAAACYVVPTLIFPNLYQIHEYYWVASTVMLMTAMGLVVVSAWETPLRATMVTAIIAAVQVGLYFQVLYPQQRFKSSGGDHITRVLKQVTQADDVLVVAGRDWSSMIPYFAQRRTMMIRMRTEREWDRIEAGLSDLTDNVVGALVLFDEQRQNLELLNRVVGRCGVPRLPVIRFENADIYVHPLRFAKVRAALPVLGAFGGRVNEAVMNKEAEDTLGEGVIVLDQLPEDVRQSFRAFTPQPVRFKTSVGLGTFMEGDQLLFGAHPDVSLWFRVPAGTHRATVEVKLVEPAYHAPGLALADASDGVQIEWREAKLGDTSGRTRQLFVQWVNPRDNPADRGLLTLQADFTLGEDCELELRVTPGPNGMANRDWVALGDVKIE